MNIHTKEHAEKLGNYIQKLCKELFRDYNAKNEWSYHIEAHTDDGNGYHTVNFSWCAVDVGFPITQHSVLGGKEIPGYHVWTTQYRPSASHWEPDDYDMETLSESLSFHHAAEAVVQEFLCWRLRMVREAEYANVVIMHEAFHKIYQLVNQNHGESK